MDTADPLEEEQIEKELRKLLDFLDLQRERVVRGESPELTLDEINAEIALARAERHAREARK